MLGWSMFIHIGDNQEFDDEQQEGNNWRNETPKKRGRNLTHK